MSYVNEKNTQNDDRAQYQKVIRRITEDKVCPFCPDQFANYHPKPILKEGKHWLLTDNAYPYEGAKHHILFVHREHIESIADIASDAWDELREFVQGEVTRRGVEGGTFYLRFGDTDATGASVSHLHANLIAPDMENPDRKPITTRVG